MPTIQFYLSALNQTFTMTTLATIENASLTPPSTNATAQINVSLSAFKSLFQFHADSIDITDVDATDIFYYTYAQNFPTINPATATLTANRVAVSGRANSLVDQDFIAYLALRLFGTADLIDIFNNESALISNLDSLGSTAGTSIQNFIIDIGISGSNGGLVADSSGNKYLTNATLDTSSGSNICRAILKAIASSDPNRLAGFTAGNNIQSIPFISGDSISFMLTINPPAGQESLTGVAVIPARTYLIQLVMNLA